MPDPDLERIIAELERRQELLDRLMREQQQREAQRDTQNAVSRRDESTPEQ